MEGEGGLLHVKTKKEKKPTASNGRERVGKHTTHGNWNQRKKQLERSEQRERERDVSG